MKNSALQNKFWEMHYFPYFFFLMNFSKYFLIMAFSSFLIDLILYFRAFTYFEI